MPYILDQAGDPMERERLALLQAHYDAKTIPKLEELGVAPGWHCHDIGAGAGSIAQWLASRVSPDGSVLAIDLDVNLLEPLASPPLSVRRLDIRTEELPGDADLVHARLLLEHLPERDEVLKRLIRALRPGGWILVTDTDFTTVRISKTDAAFGRMKSALFAAAHEAGWNIQLGPELATLLEQSGLTDVAAESWQTYGRGGIQANLFARTYRRLRDRLVNHGALPADIDRITTEMANAAVGVFGPTSWMAWGRRPA